MDPCPMFGTQIMGLIDPNGYKVFLVEQQWTFFPIPS
jgi:hypothetical protein